MSPIGAPVPATSSDACVAAAPARSYARTTRRTLTRRGLLWLGQTCNLRCYFCYFLDRITDAGHPQHRFMTLEKAKRICTTLVETYGNDAIDIQGGEPTLFPGILDLVRHCREIGLRPTLITNGLRLADADLVRGYRDAGIRDFLVSVQGLGEVYDRIVGRRGAHALQRRALRNLREAGVPFRFNTVLSRPAVEQLPDVARLAVASGALVVNFLAFNPYDDQRGNRSAEGVPRYDEIRAPLTRALDLLDRHGVEANVRYLPFCAVEERHRSKVYDFQQLSYDHHENEFASWRWTVRPSQRTREDELSPAYPLAYKHAGKLARALHRLLRRVFGEPRFVRRDDPAWHRLLREDARRRAFHDLEYRQPPSCGSCDLRRICDGFHSDYEAFFGASEARPIRLGRVVDDPTLFIREQAKVVQPEDESWAL